MKKVVLLFATVLFLFVLPSCKKTIDKQKENYVLGIMTDGVWYIQYLSEQNYDITAYFYDYEFKFYENRKLDASRYGFVETGTWAEDINNLSITANFPTADQPLKTLNQVWKIKDSYTNLVIAEANSSNGLITMWLRKK